MTILLNRHGWRRPPSGIPRVNKSSRQYIGLIHWWTANARPYSNYMGDRGTEPIDGSREGGTGNLNKRDHELGQAIYLTGTTATKINIGNIELNAPISLACWYRPDFTNGTGAQANAAMIIKPVTSESNPWYLYYLGHDNASPANPRFGVTDGGLTIGAVNATTPIKQGRLMHVVGTYTGPNGPMNIYVNGKRENTNISTVVIGTSNKNTLIGGAVAAWTNNCFKGWIGDVRIYNRALGPHDVSCLYAHETRWELYAYPNPADLLLPLLAGGTTANARSHGCIF